MRNRHFPSNNTDSGNSSYHNNSSTTTNEMPLHHRASPLPVSQVGVDDADRAAGQEKRFTFGIMSGMSSANQAAAPSSLNTKSSGLMSAPTSLNSIDTRMTSSDLEFFEDLIAEPVLVLGVDISHLTRNLQFVVCASGVFFFSLFYGYLQELISVQLCNRKLGLFLACVQFSGYTILAYVMRQLVYEKRKQYPLPTIESNNNKLVVPLRLYLGLSLLRAIDLGMTNLAMQYINYPAKTLMKSSRVVFTMIFGVVITRKSYRCVDYLIVLAMVAGLALFMHADANSSAVFHHMGVIMLTVSLICDGAITNMSESIMSKFGVGQDEFIFRMYSIALIAITTAAAYKGDMREGLYWLSQPGTYDELDLPLEDRTWSVPAKITCLVVFSSMGFFGSSCSAAITKNFGALSMSITSTARKATTLFLSFFLFNNVCTPEHISGIIIFITALTAKSLRRRGGQRRKKRKPASRLIISPSSSGLLLPTTITTAAAASPSAAAPPLSSKLMATAAAADPPGDSSGIESKLLVRRGSKEALLPVVV